MQSECRVEPSRIPLPHGRGSVIVNDRRNYASNDKSEAKPSLESSTWPCIDADSARGSHVKKYEPVLGHVGNLPHVEHVSNVLNPPDRRVAASRCEVRVSAGVQGSAGFTLGEIFGCARCVEQRECSIGNFTHQPTGRFCRSIGRGSGLHSLFSPETGKNDRIHAGNGLDDSTET